MVSAVNIFYLLLSVLLCLSGLSKLTHAADAGRVDPSIEIVDEMDDVPCFYASLGGGYASYRKTGFTPLDAKLKSDGTGFIEGGLGCQVFDWARAEAELGYRFETKMSDAKGAFSGRMSSFTGFANLWLEPFDTGNGLKPYVGGGIGFASHNLKTGYFAVLPSGGRKSQFAWQAGAGIGIDLIEFATLDFGYRYKDLGAPSAGGFGHLTAHEMRVGLRVRFGELL